jgi:hypothetical protein
VSGIIIVVSGFDVDLGSYSMCIFIIAKVGSFLLNRIDRQLLLLEYELKAKCE